MGRRKGPWLLSGSLVGSSVVFFCVLMLLDPAAPKSSPAPRPQRDPNVIEPPREVVHEVQYDKVLETSLSWLARHQFDDGSWSASAYMQMCPGRYCLGAGREEHSLFVTALAVLAFLETAAAAEDRAAGLRLRRREALERAQTERSTAVERVRALKLELQQAKRRGEELDARKQSLSSAEQDLRYAESALAVAQEEAQAVGRLTGWDLLQRDRGSSQDFRAATRRGLQWLHSQMDPSGRVGSREGRFMYGHALATLAFARAYAVLWDPLYKLHAKAALEFLVNARAPGAGWDYQPRGRDSNVCLTVWAMAAVAAARDIGLETNPGLDRELAQWLDELTDPRNYRTGYRRRGERGWGLDEYDEHDMNTAAALCIRMAIRQSTAHPAAQGAARRLAVDLPFLSPDGASVDYLYWHLGTRALAAHQGRNGNLWKDWQPRLTRGLLRAQRSHRDGCYEGSWEPSDRWGCEGGRVYATAINAVTLALVRRLAPADSDESFAAGD
ncbi:MAG: hypothetical protein HYY16_09625 [Planctomycetes bacterium]|nr:hypothetical protein [Planctomycetota bacterium]